MSLETNPENQNEALIDNTSEGTGRIEAFNDGVIAIAITLLVLEIKVPQLPPGATTGLWDELLKLWPSYGGYLTSFLVIGIIWISHHQMFKLIERTDQIFLGLNVLFLMVVSFLPFPTGLLAEYLREGREQQVAVSVYSGSMLVMAVTYNLLWFYATRNHRLISSSLSPQLLKSISRKYNTGSMFNLIAFVLSFVSYQLSLGLIVLLALYFLMPDISAFSRGKGRS